jgi:hypothetical protein
VVGLLALLVPSALIWILDAQIDAEKDDRSIPKPRCRPTCLRSSAREAALVFRAQSERLPIEHRADISTLALLGPRLVTAPRAIEPPETSPGLSWPTRR